MTARHLRINRRHHRGVTAGIYMVNLVIGFLRYYHHGRGYAVEICEPRGLHRLRLHHLAQKCPGEGTRIAGLPIPPLGQFWRAALSLCVLNVEKVGKRPDHFVRPPLGNFLPLWPMVSHNQHSKTNPSQRCTQGRAPNYWQGVGGGACSTQGGGGGMTGGDRARGLCREARCSDEGAGEGHSSIPRVWFGDVQDGGGEARMGVFGGNPWVCGGDG